MKKLIALLLALAMLCSVAAFAEETEIAEPGVSVELDQIVNFSLTMDAIPEGYVFEQGEIDGVLLFVLRNDADPEATFYAGSVAHSEEFDGYTLDVAALSEDELAQMEAMMAADWNAPAFSFAKTTHGTDLIIINENGAESDYVDVVTIYQGYFITLTILKVDGEVEQADIDLAVQALSDMWIVTAE